MWLRMFVLASVLAAGCGPGARQPAARLPAEVVLAAPAIAPLAVTGVVPEPDAAAVLFNSAVLVQFNRPVVPLTTLDNPVTQTPLQIDPPVLGSGRWISTGLYTFTPAVGWAPSTTYRLRVPGPDFTWSFTTLPPAVASTNPTPGARLVDPSAPVRITFNQPVDPGIARLTLTPAADGAVEWSDTRTLLFRPDPQLAPGTDYDARVALDGVTAPYVWHFSSAPAPRLLRSIPAEAAEAPQLNRLELFFSAPMDRDDVQANLTFQPQLDYPPYLNWTDDDTHVIIFGASGPATHVTLGLPAGTHDRFGRPMADPVALHFQTPATATSPNAPAVQPQAWLVSPTPIGTYDAYARSRAVLRTTNVTHFAFSLDALDEAAAIPLTDYGVHERMPDGRRVADGALDVQSQRNTPVLTPIDLGQLAPGYYRLRIEPRETNAPVQDHLVIVTRTTLAVKETSSQVLAWATDQRTGQPLAGLPVRVLRPGSPDPVATGSTDADGVVQLDVPPPAAPNASTVVIVDRPGDTALAASRWTGGVGPWTFGLPFGFASPAIMAHVYSDRPIYRPGQVVHLKGIVRADDDAHYSLPSGNVPSDAWTWAVQDSQGRTVSGGTLGPTDLSDYGTFTTDVDLSPEAATGTYRFTLQSSDSGAAAGVPKGKTSNPVLGSATFLVADYVRPAFDVTLDAPSSAVAGQPLEASIRAAYYFGQPLAGAPAHWQVSAAPFTFSWPADPTFRFGDLGQPTRVGDAKARPTNESRAEGTGTTAADGRLAFRMPTDLSHDLASQRFTVETTVADPEHGEVSTRQTVVVHQAALYLGLKPITFVAQAGREQTVEVVSLDVQGRPLPDVTLRAEVVRRRWLSVRERDAQGELRWFSRPEDTSVGTFPTTSGADGRGSLAFTPTSGGEYRLIVEAPDTAGNVAHTAIDLWVAGAGFIPWRISSDSRLELQADKAVYQPGDVAHVIVPAPVADATALVSVERGKLISHFAQRLSGNSAVLDIPIGSEHIPNAYVSVLLLSAGQSPTLFAGYVELSVSSGPRQLHVTAEPDRPGHAPGDTVAFTIHTRDGLGNGVPAEVSLALVDAAVLATADSTADPVLAFWHHRPLAIRTGSSLGVSIDRMNESASSGLKGGGGGAEQTSVRQDFPDTAFWQPAVRTDAAGEVHVEVRLPDTLTTWRLTAVAVTADTRLGVATAEVVTTKPLLIRPLAPRFLVAGDTVTIGASLHNTTASPMQVAASLQAGHVAVQGDLERSIEVPAGGEARVDWPVTSAVSGGGEAGQVTLRFAVAAPGVSDAVELQLPLLAWGASSTVASAGEVRPAETLAETLELPNDVDRQRGELRLEVVSSLAAALRVSLHQVEDGPYESLEQTVSRFVPRLALTKAIDGRRLGDPLNLKAELPGLVTRSIERIYRYQHADGGWGWWRDDASQPYLTAYAVFGLVEARGAGFAVDQGVLDRATTFLRRWLNGDPGAFGLDTRAYVVYVLGEAGAPEPARAAALFDRRADLGPTARAYLAQSLARLDASDSRVGGLLAELTSSAIVSATGAHWEEANSVAKPWIMATGVRTTAAVLDALVRWRPDHPLVSPAVRWLMAARRGDQGFWESSHATSMSVLALTDYLSVKDGELHASFEWQVGLNGVTQQHGTVGDPSGPLPTPAEIVVPIPSLRIGENSVTLLRSTGTGNLYYSLRLTTFSQGADIPFVSQGLTVAREYLPPDAASDTAPLSHVHAGELVQVRLTLMAPAELHDVVIDDPLPAGLQPLDARLRTTAAATGASQTQGWQPWTHVDVRADKVTLFATYLARGAYQYAYLARASLPGEYHVLPTQAREQYFPEVFARGDGRHFTVLP